MIDFLKLLRALPFDGDVYGLISVGHLKLLSKDSHQSTHWVSIEPSNRGITVSGLLGKPMIGRVDEFREFFEDPAEAAKMTLSALEWSHGWKRI